MSTTIRITGLEEARAIVASAGSARARTILQQSVNRAGRAEKGHVTRAIKAHLPVKLKYLNARVIWRDENKNGQQGRLRIYGTGKGGSAWVRPRNMALRYANNRIGRSGLRGVRSKKISAVTFGVAGLVPRRSVIRGFVSSVGAGRKFSHSYQDGFARTKAQVFFRTGFRRMPIGTERGITLGEVAVAAGIPRQAGAAIGAAASKEFARRWAIEQAKTARQRR